MASVIDSLVVELGLDASKFQAEASTTEAAITKTGRTAVRESKELEEGLRKTQQSTDKRLKQTAEVGKQASQHFNKFRVEVAALFATLATGFGFSKFIENVVNSDSALGLQAKAIGISTTQLATWEEAVKRAGGSTGDAASAFQGLTADFESFRRGGPSQAVGVLMQIRDGAHQAGVQWSDLHGQMRPVKDILMDIGDVVSKWDAPRRNSLLSGLPGMNAGMANFLSKSRQEREAILAQMEKQGVPDDAAAQRALDFQNSIKDTMQRAQDLGRAIFRDLKPAIDAVIKAIGDWYDKNKDWLKADIESHVSGLAGDIKAVAEAIGPVITALGGWKNAFEALLGLWAVSKFAGVIGALTSVVKLLAVIPGSGISLSTLGSLGIAIAPLALVGAAGGEDKEFSDQKNEEYKNSHPNQHHGWSGALSDLWGSITGYIGGGTPGGASGVRKMWLRDRLSKDLGITPESASGIVSNLNAESGISGINEKNPLIPGSRGGFGWAQWTGPRRNDFEGYAANHHLDPASDDANYGFLIEELTNKYPAVLAQLRRGSITATEAADIVARGYIVPPAATLGAHVGGAAGIAKLGPSVASIDPAYRRGISNGSAFASAKPTTQSNDNSVEAHIGAVNVYTTANNSTDIAKDIGPKLQRYAFVRTANTGLA